MAYACGRLIHDADSHLIELHDCLDPYFESRLLALVESRLLALESRLRARFKAVSVNPQIAPIQAWMPSSSQEPFERRLAPAQVVEPITGICCRAVDNNPDQPCASQ